jgi:C-terminal processing protease CtpA/Prc
MARHILPLVLVMSCAAAAPATQLALPPTRPADVPVADAVVDAALRTDTYYQQLQQVLDKLETELAQNRLGTAHPRTLRLRATREAVKKRMDDRRAAVARDLGAGAGPWQFAFAGEGLGLVVTKAPPAMTAALPVPRGSGLVVDRVLKGSAAAGAGLMPGDLVYRLDGQLLVNNEQFEVVVESLENGRDVEVQLVRDGSPLKRTVRVRR